MTTLVLKVQGVNHTDKVFIVFRMAGHACHVGPKARGGWYTLTVESWAGTHYAGLIHARKAVPGVRIHCPSARSECQS